MSLRTVLIVIAVSALLACGSTNQGPSASLTLTVSLPTAASGWVETPLGLIAKDASGQIVTTYVGTVHFTSSDPLAVLPPNYTFVASDSGSFGINCGRPSCHWLNVTFKTAGTQTLIATDVNNASITGRESLAVGLARCAAVPPPWTQPCRRPPLFLVVNQRTDTIHGGLTWNAGDGDAVQVPPDSTQCHYAFEAFNSTGGVVDDSAYFDVGVIAGQFVSKAKTGWHTADSTATAFVWRAAPDSALKLTIFPDTTPQGAWHIATSFAAPCQGAIP